jgi:hypothetical protein
LIGIHLPIPSHQGIRVGPGPHSLAKLPEPGPLVVRSSLLFLLLLSSLLSSLLSIVVVVQILVKGTKDCGQVILGASLAKSPAAVAIGVAHVVPAAAAVLVVLVVLLLSSLV